MDRDKAWTETTIIGFDLETSGKYPLGAEICEMAAVKWRKGEIVDQFQTLIKPSHVMSDEVIKIHNITNEMVADAPSISDKISEFRDFIDDGFMVAHHSPFDMGFLALEFENAGLDLPDRPVLCSSLISRNVFMEVENHKLVTLAAYLGIDVGQSHRALDDAQACLQLTLKCLEKLGQGQSIDQIIEVQGQELRWEIFSMNELRSNPVFSILVEAIEDGEKVNLVYEGGSRPGKTRLVIPEGIVRRSRVDDFLVAKSSPEDQHPKRYFLKKILEVRADEEPV